MFDSAPAGTTPEDLTVSMVAAVAQNRVIGVDGEMPWHYPADLRHFKQTTTGHPVIMGRRTYESIVARIDGPLPGRTNIVLSSGDPEYKKEVQVVGSVQAALSAAQGALSGASETDGPDADSGTAFVIGGASVYKQFLPLADRLVITEVPVAPEGDTVFPTWDQQHWAEINREQDGELTFVTYERQE